MMIVLVSIDQVLSWTTTRLLFPPSIIEDVSTLKLVNAQNKHILAHDCTNIMCTAREIGDGKDLCIKFSA